MTLFLNIFPLNDKGYTEGRYRLVWGDKKGLTEDESSGGAEGD